jgi:hypothetical protein
MIRLDSSLSREEIDQIVDDLVPADERGPRSKDFPTDVMSEMGGGMATIRVFENVSIDIYGATSHARKHETIADEVVATIKWKNRKCQ